MGVICSGGAMRLPLVIFFFSSFAISQEKPNIDQLIESTKDECKALVNEVDKARLIDYRAHLLRISIDDIFYKLSLREKIINEGAIESQKDLDNDLFSRIYYNMEKMAQDPETMRNLKFIKTKIDTQPLVLEKGLNVKLKSKFVSLGL
jgi:hypothetical protein